MAELQEKHCQPCEGGTPPLTATDTRELLQHIHPDWHVNSDNTEISRDFKFTNYYETMAFVNASAWISHQQDHHPDLEVGYKHCLVRYSTHAINGLSENDFICAAKLDELLASG